MQERPGNSPSMGGLRTRNRAFGTVERQVSTVGVELLGERGVLVALALCLTSAILCRIAIARSGVFLGFRPADSDIRAVQAQHALPTPRVGGVAVILALALGVVLMQDRIGADLMLALVAGVFVFAVGLREDLCRDMSPRIRLLASFVSAGIAIVLSAAMVPGLGLVQTDWMFAYLALAFAVTLIWSAGMCNALNLIDGLNGLAAGYAATCAIGLSIVAGYAGQADIQIVSLLLIAAIAGFLVFNWPLGRIFLGDAGAYAIGHVLAWLGIILMVRAPQVAGLAILLLLFWPVADTFVSIVRRKLRNKATDRPDRLHFHHIVVRALRLLVAGRLSHAAVNSAATVVIAPLFAAPVMVGVLLWNEPVYAFTALLLFSGLFAASYLFAMDFFANRRFVPREEGRSGFWDADTVEREISPLSGIYIQDSAAVDVRIERRCDQAHWRLSTAISGGTGEVWPTSFVSDREAWEAFLAVAQTEGMPAVTGDWRAVAQTRVSSDDPRRVSLS